MHLSRPECVTPPDPLLRSNFSSLKNERFTTFGSDNGVGIGHHSGSNPTQFCKILKYFSKILFLWNPAEFLKNPFEAYGVVNILSLVVVSAVASSCSLELNRFRCVSNRFAPQNVLAPSRTAAG